MSFYFTIRGKLSIIRAEYLYSSDGGLPCPRWMEIVWCGPGAYPGRPQTRILLTSSWVSILHQEVCLIQFGRHFFLVWFGKKNSCFYCNFWLGNQLFITFLVGKAAVFCKFWRDISCILHSGGNISCLLSLLAGKSAVFV